jgi:integrase/recombinase XerD
MDHTPRRLTDDVPSYCAALRGAGRRARGIDKYDRTMRRFIAWLGDEATQASITAASVEQYQATLALTCSTSTICNALSTIRSFCKWSMRRGYRSDDPTVSLDWPRKQRPLPRPYSRNEIATVLAALDLRPADDGWITQRNRRAVLLMLCAGLRLSEAAALQWRDVDLAQQTLTVRDGKGGKQRCIPLHPQLRAELDTVPDDERTSDQAVAGQRDGRCLCYKALSHVFDRWLRKRGVHVTAHRLRHTFATELLRHGANIRYIQRLLGHSDLKTTEIYLGIYDNELHDAVQRVPAW